MYFYVSLLYIYIYLIIILHIYIYISIRCAELVILQIPLSSLGSGGPQRAAVLGVSSGPGPSNRL